MALTFRGLMRRTMCAFGDLNGLGARRGTDAGRQDRDAQPGALRWLVNRGFLRDLLVIGVVLRGRMSCRLLVPGILLFVLGALLHFWSKACLMRNFTVTRQGPYRLVRHPFYLASFVIDLGICLIAGAPHLILFYIPLFLLSYIPVIRSEERFLTETHGDAYRQFAREVPMLIPYKLHRLWGPWDGTWTTIWRENEISRLSRILAIPFYILFVDAVYHHHLTGHLSVPLVVVSALGAIACNLLSIYSRKWGRKRLMDLSDL